MNDVTRPTVPRCDAGLNRNWWPVGGSPLAVMTHARTLRTIRRMAASSRFSPPTGRPLVRTVVTLVVGFVLLCAAVVAAGWVLTHPLKSITGEEDDLNLWLADQRTGTLTHVADVGTILGET